MINTQDYIRLTNIISQKFYFNYKDFDKAMEEFLNNIGSLKVEINGFPFYSHNVIPTINENIGVEFFIQVKENFVEVPDDMMFHSYFSIENMISLNIVEDYEKNGEEAYNKLVEYIKDNNLVQSTPYFNVFLGDDKFQYSSLKVGVSKIE